MVVKIELWTARRRIVIITISTLFSVSIYAANPFLASKDDKPVSANFSGTEWGDEIQQDEMPLTARVVTTRVSTMPWGAIFKIEFTDLKSDAPQEREIRPDYFIVTDDRIIQLNEEDNDAAVKKISALEKPRNFIRATFTESRLVSSITKMGYGKRRSF